MADLFSGFRLIFWNYHFPLVFFSTVNIEIPCMTIKQLNEYFTMLCFAVEYGCINESEFNHMLRNLNDPETHIVLEALMA
jgi:Ca2+-binding EF-hand superfamily protein